MDSSIYETDNSSFYPLPVVYYTQGSGLFYRASILLNFFTAREKPINPSQIQLAAEYTTKQQTLFVLPFQLFWQQNNWRRMGKLGYYNYDYPFYGVENTNQKDKYSSYRAPSLG